MIFLGEGRTSQKKVLTALAMGIPGVEDNFFDEYHTEPANQIRLLHYPSAPVEVFASGKKGRIAAHTVTALFPIMALSTLAVLSYYFVIRISERAPYSSKILKINGEALKSKIHTMQATSSLCRPSKEPSYLTSATSLCVGLTVSADNCTLDNRNIILKFPDALRSTLHRVRAPPSQTDLNATKRSRSENTLT